MAVIATIKKKASPQLGVKRGYVKGSWTYILDNMEVGEKQLVKREFIKSIRSAASTFFNNVPGGKRFSTTVKSSAGAPKGKVLIKRELDHIIVEEKLN